MGVFRGSIRVRLWPKKDAKMGVFNSFIFVALFLGISDFAIGSHCDFFNDNCVKCALEGECVYVKFKRNLGFQCIPTAQFDDFEPRIKSNYLDPKSCGIMGKALL